MLKNYYYCTHNHTANIRLGKMKLIENVENNFKKWKNSISILYMYKLILYLKYNDYD